MEKSGESESSSEYKEMANTFLRLQKKNIGLYTCVVLTILVLSVFLLWQHIQV